MLSLANGAVGVLRAATLSVHAIGRGYAQASGGDDKHGVKQVDRLLSNDGVDVWALFECRSSPKISATRWAACTGSRRTADMGRRRMMRETGRRWPKFLARAVLTPLDGESSTEGIPQSAPHWPHSGIQ